MRYVRQTKNRLGEWVNHAHPTSGENVAANVYERIWARRGVRYVDTKTGKILDRDTLTYGVRRAI